MPGVWVWSARFTDFCLFCFWFQQNRKISKTSFICIMMRPSLIIQTTFSKAFSGKKRFIFWFKFKRLFLMVRLTICKHRIMSMACRRNKRKRENRIICLFYGTICCSWSRALFCHKRSSEVERRKFLINKLWLNQHKVWYEWCSWFYILSR